MGRQSATYAHWAQHISILRRYSVGRTYRSARRPRASRTSVMVSAPYRATARITARGFAIDGLRFFFGVAYNDTGAASH